MLYEVITEIGTATGGNVLPMAASLPESRFVAIDRADESLAVARTHAEGARLENLALHLTDIREFHDEPATYDYIVITSYSIHYTKLYEREHVPQVPERLHVRQRDRLREQRVHRHALPGGDVR